jgi:hypothetical protein
VLPETVSGRGARGHVRPLLSPASLAAAAVIAPHDRGGHCPDPPRRRVGGVDRRVAVVTCACACGRWSLLSAELEEKRGSGDDLIHWTWRLIDERLPDGFAFIHAATPRVGHPLRQVRHTTTAGLYWLDPIAEFDGVGLPTADAGDLLVSLYDVIEDELRRVDLARMLLIHCPPRPLRHAA